MFIIVIIFMGLSLLLYVLFGGADFGAGILELFSKKKYRSGNSNLTYKAIGPVWEANHIWIIVLVVILFNGFPKIYAALSTYLHIPLLLMLIGILIRGTAFVFRHYDAYNDNSTRYYSAAFMISSLWTPFFLGVIAGAMFLGKINPEGAGFYEVYMAPWFNIFGLAMGIFTVCIFSFLAAVFLIGETQNQAFREQFLLKAKISNICTVVAGGLVFLAAEFEGLSLLSLIVNQLPALLSIILATISLPLLWWSLQRRQIILPRLIAGFQVLMILSAWLSPQLPVMIKVQNGQHLTLMNTVAPATTITVLGISLLVAGACVIPALVYLLKAFKWRQGVGY